jgi:uncharacterized protein YjdB
MTVDRTAVLSATNIPDSTVYRVIVVMTNYGKAQKKDSALADLPEGADLTSSAYDAYTASVTVGDVIDYCTQTVDLSVYGDKITTIEGVGYARSASGFNLAGIPITAIPADEFAMCDSMTKITLPSGVKTIGDRAFNLCTKLETVAYEGHEATEQVVDLTAIDRVGDEAFYGCSSITTVNFKEYDEKNELYLGKSSFAACTGITKVVIPIANADNLGSSAFAGCQKLDEIVLRDDLTYIPASVFSATIASKITIPSNISYIGASAFQDTKMVTADFSNCTKLKSIKQGAFSGALIYEVKLPDSLEEIESLAFNASTIMKIAIPANVTKIQEKTFYDCEYLYDISIKDAANSKLSTIEKEAFRKCISLPDTKFLADVTKLESIGEYAFADCSGYYTNSAGTAVTSILGTRTYGDFAEVVLPDCVTTLGTGAFYGNYSLRKITLGSGIKEIPEKAFYCATSSNSIPELETVILPQSVEKIGKEAFYGCKRLDTVGYSKNGVVVVEEGLVQFPDTLISIEQSAFQYCSTRLSCTLISKIVYVDADNLFTEERDGTATYMACKDGDSALQVFYVNPDNLKAEEFDGAVKLYVAGRKYWITDTSAITTTKPATDVLSSYVQSSSWFTMMDTDLDAYQDYISDGKNSTVYIPKEDLSTTEVADGTAIYLLDTTYIKVGSEVTTQGEFYAPKTQSLYLKYDFGIKNLTLPDSVETLGTSVFANNTNLVNVVLSDRLTEIPNSAFANCGDKLYDITTGKEITYSYVGLQSIVFPEKLEKIGSSAFIKCYAFDLPQNNAGWGVFPDTLKEIGASAFNECYHLTSVQFPSLLETIGASAFKQCAQTESVKAAYYDSTNTAKTDTVTVPVAGNGLSKVNFTYAVRLKSIGSSAFASTPITSVNITKSELTKIESNLFQNCWYLENVTCPSTITSVGSNAFQNCNSLRTVSIPASATVESTILSQHVDALSHLSFTVSADEKSQQIPIGESITLPINAFNSSTLSGSFKVSVKQEDGEYVELQEGADNDGIIGYTVEQNSKKIWQVTLYGNKLGEVSVRVEATWFGENKSGNTSQLETMEYDVVVDEVPAASVTLSDKNLLTDNDSKILYLSAESAPYTLQALITPMNVTHEPDLSYWNSSVEGIVTLSDAAYVEKTGTAAVIVTPDALGTTKVTLAHSGLKDECNVKVVAPAKSLSYTVETTGKQTSTLTMALDAENQIHANLTFDDKYADTLDKDEVVFTSSNPEVVTVDGAGNIKAVGIGTAKITIKTLAVTTKSTGKTATVTVNVKDEYTPDADSVTIIGADTVNVKGSITLEAAVLPSNASQDVTWTVSSGDTIASVKADADGNGVVTGLKPGKATIKATTANNRSQTYSVTVLQPASSINIIESTVTVYRGKTYSISKATTTTAKEGFRVTPADSTDSVTWTSSDAKIASITQSGDSVNITANKQGSAVLTATTTSGKMDKVTIRVVEPITTLTLKKIAATVNVNKTIKLSATKAPANSSEKLTWISSNKAVATVSSSGVVTGKRAGTTTITVKSESGKTATCTVSVKVPATKIAIRTASASAKKIYVSLGTTYRLGYSVTPGNTTDTITFSSSKQSVATVDKTTGTITPKKKGTIKVAVKTTSGKKATIIVCVVKKAVKSKKVKLSGASTVKVGKTIKLTAKVTPAKSTDTITYKVNKSAYASVDSTGTVTGKKKGTVKVTVTTSSGKKATKTIKVK